MYKCPDEGCIDYGTRGIHDLYHGDNFICTEPDSINETSGRTFDDEDD